jgi:hypothetical protein
MKTRTIKFTTTFLFPAIYLICSGCGTAPPNPLATQEHPSLAGGMSVVDTHNEKAVVTGLVPSQRTVTLRASNGTTTSCKVAPQVENFGQLQDGDKVKATIADAVAIFPTKNGPPPNAGAGVTVAGPAEAGQPASVVLLTSDTQGKVTKVDRSYRLFTVAYADGNTKEFKVALPDTLKGLQKGDEVVVRSTEPLAICVKSR